MKRLLPWLFRFGAIGLLAGVVLGCASSRIDWNTRVGTYSYDDAVREYGPPDKSAQLTDGSTVADWMTARGGMQTATAYGSAWSPRPRYGWGGPAYVVVDPPTPDRFLRLTFDPQGKLASWQRVYR
ncbi:MAG: hypothetical protein IT580_12230 [Verrucomicrobiales bacterium]|nr:hypothetical protein [Verrucomicrobiales bacterium]